MRGPDFLEMDMTPEELGRLHPKLFHVSAAGAAKSILEHGLFSTECILTRWNVPPEQMQILMSKRRSKPVSLDHPTHGRVTISDNAPLSETKLAKVLDDNLTVGEWLEMLNRRVFFFVSRNQLSKLVESRLNKRAAKDILIFDTSRLVRAYREFVEIVPINSGNTNHNAARRGLATFAPLLQTDYAHWRRQRANKTPDVIKEISVRSSIRDISNFLIDVEPGVA